jgi:flagellar protein FlgJ
MEVTALPKHVVAADIAPERLANNPALSEQQKIAEASRQFEAILLRQILAASQKTVIPSKFADNSTSSEIYRDMITNQMADTMSKSGGFGLAQAFEKQLTRPEPSFGQVGSGRHASAAHPTQPTRVLSPLAGEQLSPTRMNE